MKMRKASTTKTFYSIYAKGRIQGVIFGISRPIHIALTFKELWSNLETNLNGYGRNCFGNEDAI